MRSLINFLAAKHQDDGSAAGRFVASFHKKLATPPKLSTALTSAAHEHGLHRQRSHSTERRVFSSVYSKNNTGVTQLSSEVGTVACQTGSLYEADFMHRTPDLAVLRCTLYRLKFSTGLRSIARNFYLFRGPHLPLSPSEFSAKCTVVLPGTAVRYPNRPRLRAS
jgi:hypothetical protein